MEVVQVENIPELSDIKDVLVDDKEEQMLAYRTCKQMEIVCDENNGIGLNAVQVGIPWRLFIIKTNGKFEHFLNCTYEPVGEDKVTSIEGCLSLRSDSGEFRKFEMTRSLIVKVIGKKLVSDCPLSGLTVEDFSAYIHAEDQGVVFQHEIDHDLGSKGLISNKGKEVFIW